MIKKVNYYQVLEVGGDATFEEIKKAFRAMAKLYHPDKKKDCKVSEGKFKIINEAYQTLSCEKRRLEYDKTLSARKRFSMDELYTDLGKEYETKGKKLEVVGISLTLQESYFGCEKEIEYTEFDSCSACNGTGAQDGKVRDCPKCVGLGHFVRQVGFMNVTSDCDNCEGKGYFYIESCPECDGNGLSKTKSKMVVFVPKGINQGDRVKLSVSENKEVLLSIKISNNTEYVRQEYSLYHKVDISLKDILLGSNVKVELFGSVVEIEIPSNSKHKDLIVVKGKGFPVLNTEEYGDFVLELNLVYPELNEKNKELIKALKG